MSPEPTHRRTRVNRRCLRLNGLVPKPCMLAGEVTGNATPPRECRRRGALRVAPGAACPELDAGRGRRGNRSPHPRRAFGSDTKHAQRLGTGPPHHQHGHRKTLCEIYGQPPEILFAHQDAGLRAAGSPPRLLAGFADLREAMLATVSGACECLVAAGSRPRDADYLTVIEAVLAERPALVHYRVLFGPPHHRVLRDHLLRLLELRDPADRSLGIKTLHLGHRGGQADRAGKVLLRKRADGSRADPVADLGRGVRLRGRAWHSRGPAAAGSRTPDLRRRPPGRVASAGR